MVWVCRLLLVSPSRSSTIQLPWPQHPPAESIKHDREGMSMWKSPESQAICKDVPSPPFPDPVFLLHRNQIPVIHKHPQQFLSGKSENTGSVTNRRCAYLWQSTSNPVCAPCPSKHPNSLPQPDGSQPQTHMESSEQLSKHWSWHAHQWNRTETQEISPLILRSTDYQKGHRDNLRGKNNLLNEWCWSSFTQALSSLHAHKVTQHGSKDLHVSTITMTLTEVNLHGLALGNGFLEHKK